MSTYFRPKFVTNISGRYNKENPVTTQKVAAGTFKKGKLIELNSKNYHCRHKS